MTLDALTDLVEVIGFPLIIIQLFYLIRSYKDEHERSRRENAVKLISDWTKSLDQKSSIARKLIETFTQEQCKSLDKQDSIEVDVKYIEEIKACFSIKNINTELSITGNNVRLSNEQTVYLRWLAITYLNSIESIFLAWLHHVADREIIESEFQYLIDDREGHSLLHTLRTAMNIDAYPGINEFAREIRKKRENPAKGKKKIG
jgi:hypothetical protein